MTSSGSWKVQPRLRPANSRIASSRTWAPRFWLGQDNTLNTGDAEEHRVSLFLVSSTLCAPVSSVLKIFMLFRKGLIHAQESNDRRFRQRRGNGGSLDRLERAGDRQPGLAGCRAVCPK